MNHHGSDSLSLFYHISDSGIVQTLKQPVYIVRVKDRAVHYLDRNGQVNLAYVDPTEYNFKRALLERFHCLLLTCSHFSSLFYAAETTKSSRF